MWTLLWAKKRSWAGALLRMGGINFNINVGRAALGGNFDVTTGRAACEASSATWNLGTNTLFALGPRKTTENLNRVGYHRSKHEICLNKI
jgi:hypothetical protein